MSIGTFEGTTYTPATETGVMDNILGGLQAPMLKDNELLDSSSAFWAATIYAGIGLGIGSTVARKRQADSKEPILGFFF